MATAPVTLARAHIKPGTKFYHGGHGTSHFGSEDELHLPEAHVQRLVADGLLHTGPVAAAAASVEGSAPAPEAVPEQPDVEAEQVTAEPVPEEPQA